MQKDTNVARRARLTADAHRGNVVTIDVDGDRVLADLGETIATALLASGRRVLRRTHYRQQPRGIYCGMGVCFDCLVTVNGTPNVRACATFVEDGMSICTGAQHDD